MSKVPKNIEIVDFLDLINNVAIMLNIARSNSHDKRFNDSFILGSFTANIENVLIDFKTHFMSINPEIANHLPGIPFKAIAPNPQVPPIEDDTDKSQMVS